MSDIDAYKQELVDACRTLLERGYLKATEGNVSIRISGREAMAITPSNYDYARMQPADICVLDLEAGEIECRLKPSIESGMHAGVYRTRPDVHAIVHTHQTYASALALIDQSIPALFDEQVRFLGRSVDILPYAPSGTMELAQAVMSRIGNANNAFILQNHGALVLGGSTSQAMHNTALLEKCAAAYLLALLTEKRISKIPLSVQELMLAKLREDEKRFSSI
jgi:ribulose-5-phosphate 4-epimerase/fuculose-1-phosphate aldolase